jgi:hypothetical protein
MFSIELCRRFNVVQCFLFLTLKQIHKVSRFIQTVIATAFHYRKALANNSLKRDSILPSGIIYPFPKRFICYGYDKKSVFFFFYELFGKSIQQHINYIQLYFICRLKGTLSTFNYISSIG